MILVGNIVQTLAKVNNRVFVRLDIRYTDYFPEYAKYFGRDFILLKSVYGMTNYGKFFVDELTEWLLEAGFIQSQCQISIYYKYAPDGSKIVVLSYVDDCVYWYTNEYIGKWFVGTLGKRFHVNFLEYEHWFMSIRISQMKYHSVSVDQTRYATSIVAKYLDTVTVKVSTQFYKTTFPADMIFTKEDVSFVLNEKIIEVKPCIKEKVRALSSQLSYTIFMILT